jgi:threonyl-tRNA synthetase
MNDNFKHLNHSCAHLLAAAVTSLWPKALPTLGPAIENGFYYDFDFGKIKISEADLPKIESKMHEIAPGWKKFEKINITPEQAKKSFAKDPYKLELIDEINKRGETLTLYKSGDFIDLCRGGHTDLSRKSLKHFKLLSVAGAYWRGNEKNKMLTRIYGTCWPSQKELNEYLYLLDESKNRDHRKLGKDLDIFMLSDQVGPGLPLWLPHGMIIKEELEKWGKETEKKWGYQRVSTPFLTKRDLFVTSGHVPYFEDEMYRVSVPGDDKEEQYYVKPMNCPFHHLIFKNKTRSYRELPLRLAEYGTVARYENAGSINGILRPRLFIQNDAHIYCSEEQAVDVFVEIINLHRYYYDILGLKNYHIVLCLRDPEKLDKYHGEEELWQKSEKLSREAMDKAGIEYKVENEGAAHYGPKMDFKIKSAIGTEYGISTNQIDLYMPRRFDLKYIDKDGQEKFVVVQHRAPLGSSERFVGFLLEHFAGAFPTWLSPTQVKVLPITDKHLGYARTVHRKLLDADIRSELDGRNEPLSGRIRDAQLEKASYMLVVGDREMAEDTVNERGRSGKIYGTFPIQKFIANIRKEIDGKLIV